MAPAKQGAIFLPQPEPDELASRLPVVVQERLGGTELVTARKPQWDLVLTQLKENEGFRDMTAPEVNQLITCMDLEKRAQLSSTVLDMMKLGDVKPNTLTFDLLMMAHAEVGNQREVKSLFDQVKQSMSTFTHFPIALN
jgi:CO dehydrogenase/acetyl-CoA synthase alpha subunit